MLNRILSLVGWLGTALVCVAVAIWIVPNFERFLPYMRPLAIAGLICVLAYSFGQWREIGEAFSGRQARYGTLTGFSVLVVLGILVAINYIGARQNKRWDLTANKQFSLSDQTRNVLVKLDSPMQLTVFAQEPEFQRYRDKLNEYTYVSNKVTTDYVDPDKKPSVAKQNQVQQYGTIVIAYKGRTERVTTDTEQDITNGIIKAVSGQQRKIYFTQGHGERDTASSERDGYAAIVAALGRENYTVDKVVLAQTGAVPADASAVIVAGPRRDFEAVEIDALKKYLGGSGKLLLELDPPETADAPPVTNLIALAHDWGMNVGNDIVVDPIARMQGADAVSPFAASYPSHPITQRFNVLTLFPLVRSVSPVSGGVNGHTAQPVIETSSQSWAESDVKGLLTAHQAAKDESKGDKAGPIAIAAAVSAASPVADVAKPDAAAPDAPKPEARVVVLGDSDFATNGVLGVQGNRDMFMNTIGWLSQQENLISIRPKEADDRRITLTASQQNFINLLSLLVIPACIFGTGVYTWWRRR